MNGFRIGDVFGFVFGRVDGGVQQRFAQGFHNLAYDGIVGYPDSDSLLLALEYFGNLVVCIQNECEGTWDMRFDETEQRIGDGGRIVRKPAQVVADDGIVQILFPLVFDLGQPVDAFDVGQSRPHAVYGIGGVYDDASVPEAFHDMVNLFGLQLLAVRFQ